MSGHVVGGTRAFRWRGGDQDERHWFYIGDKFGHRSLLYGRQQTARHLP